MRRIATALATLLVAGGAAAYATADDTNTYELVMYNAFGLVEGSEVKVAGVNAGTVTDLAVNDEKQAVLTVELSGPLSVLGENTRCSSEPQSLIAEYFIDCKPAGPPLGDGETLPNKVSQTVQNDLVLNTMREPFRDRFRLLINEFGTALAGNPENLNEAIELGAPALQDLNKALDLIADQNSIIRQLNVDSDQIVARLNERSDDVVRFIQEAGDVASAAAERRDDLSTDFDLLDDALRELGPTMVELEDLAREQTPLLTDLRAAAPTLNTLADRLPGFARATERSLVSLGAAAGPGKQAMRSGQDEIQTLAEAARNAPSTAQNAAFFLQDLDDPRRIVEIDDRAARDCADETRPCWATGREHPTGYTGLEGLLNYLYFQGGAINQFDEVGHTLHFSLYDVFATRCGEYNPTQEVPLENSPSGTTTNILEADSCVGWLGPTQPGINEDEADICAKAPPGQLCSPRWDDSVCPEGSNAPAECDPSISLDSAGRARRTGGGGGGGGAGDGSRAPAGGGGDEGLGLPVDPGELPKDPDDVRKELEDLLGETGGKLGDLPGKLGDLGGRGGRDGGGGKLGGAGQATEDLLDFLLGP